MAIVEFLLVLVILLLCVIAALILMVMFKLWRHRLEPFDSAAAALKDMPDGIQIRQLSHGVAFIPANAVDENVGMLYLQGALVHCMAYAPLCREIAQLSGSPVVLMGNAPLRIATLGQSKIPEAMAQVPESSRWAIGGHSAGGYGAAKFIVDTSRNQKMSQEQLIPKFHLVGLLLHAARIGIGKSKNCTLADRDDISVLQILGANDKIVEAGSDPGVENSDAGKAALPQSRVQEIVAGCNHAGFGHYGPQVYPRRDGEATLSKTELQHVIAEKTANWLKSL